MATEGNVGMGEKKRPAENAVIIIPSLEPDDRLPAYIHELAKNGFGRILVIDDGSSDAYQPVFREVEEIERTTVLHHPVNRGKGAALKTGYQYILDEWPECNVVITADSDGQHKIEDCIRLARMPKEGDRTVYLGSRDFSLPDIPPKSRSGNKITSIVFKLFYGQWLPDTQTGLRAFRREELPFMTEVKGDRYEYEMNVLISCRREGIQLVPVTIETVYENGKNEGTHFHPIRDSWRIYKTILGSFFRFMGTSLLCFLIDYAIAFCLREWLLPAAGLNKGESISVNSAAAFIIPVLVFLLSNENISGLCARVISSSVNFLLNKKLVFRLKGSAGKAAFRYILLCILIISISNLGVLLIGRIGLSHLEWLFKMIIDTMLYFLSFRLQQRWVFREGKK